MNREKEKPMNQEALLEAIMLYQHLCLKCTFLDFMLRADLPLRGEHAILA